LLQGWLPQKVFRAVESYGPWLESTLQKRGKTPWWKLTRSRLGQLLIEILLLVGVLNYSTQFYPDLVLLLEKSGLVIPQFVYFYMGIVALICATLLIAAWRNWSAMSMIYAEALAGKDRIKRGLLQNGLQLVGSIILGWIFLLSMPDRVTESWLSLIFVLFVALFISVFWRRMIRWQSAVQHTLNTTLTSSAPSCATALNVRPKDWNVEVIECLLPELASVRGQSLNTIGLRTRFGCSLVEIERQGVRIPNPRPDVQLFPGDKLLLFGTEEQTQAARLFLLNESDETESEKNFDTVTLHTLTVPIDSPRSGSLLKELSMIDTLCTQILGIRRREMEILNPGGKDRLESGDELLLLTSENGAKRLLEWLSERPA
jgi:monovalent cation:H+ antiporter-2, CPA2 family